MKKKIGTIFMIAFVFTVICSEGVLAFPQDIYLSNTKRLEDICEPKKDKIDYVYQVFDGVLYKRLYNFTTHEYIGDWIRV